MVDIYLQDPPSSLSLHHVARQLSAHCVKSWKNERHPRNRELWSSLARFGTRCFEEVLKSPYLMRLHPEEGSEGSLGFASLAPSLGDLLERTEIVASRLKNEQRAEELRAFCELIRTLQLGAEDEDLYLILLGRSTIVSSPKWKEVQELDGVLARIAPSGIEWLIAEVKDTRRGTGSGQLSELQRRVRVNLGEVAVRRGGGGRKQAYYRFSA